MSFSVGKFLQEGVLCRRKDYNLQMQYPSSRLFHSATRLWVGLHRTPKVDVLIRQYKHQIWKEGVLVYQIKSEGKI